jgi:hypothetical protein
VAETGKWIHEASQREIVVRSLKVAAVVGTLLVAINHGDRLLSSQVDLAAWLKIGLTYLVPYGVATYAAVSTRLGEE